MLQKTSLKARTGGQVLVDQLLIHGADTAYCVPGESYLEVLDALHDVQDRFTLINARHEAGAANMAETYGKLTGTPGICMVTRGPGACHAAIGVHIAQQDSTPMILLVGQIARDTTDREAFQEVDYRAMFGPIAKWATQIDDPARVPEYMARAFRVATSGRPGPVVISLPEDMLTEVVSVADARPYTATHAGLSPDNLDMLKTEIAQAERPLLLLGGSGWDDKATPENVAKLGHVGTADHNAFNVTPTAVLNVARDSMADVGFSPATRVFEAAGAGACLITDAWEGIEQFLAPGEEVLVARDGQEVAELLAGLTPARAAAIGAAARRRVLADHTYARRAAEADGLFRAALAGRPARSAA